MGMAASQARYLGLTARKTNVEYEGQQVNQARTALANQSANTFNDLLTLEVPTAPSTQDFTTLQYSYKDGTNGETISNMTELQNDPDGYNYLVTHYHFADVYNGIRNYKENPQVQTKDITSKGAIERDRITSTTDGTTTTYFIDGVEVNKYDPNDELQKNAVDKMTEDNPDFALIDPDKLVYYADEKGQMHFTSTDALDDVAQDATDYFVEPEIPTLVGNAELKKYDPTDKTLQEAYKQICKDWPNDDIVRTDPGDIYTWEFQGKTYFATKDDLINTANSAPDKTKPTENQAKLQNYNAQDVKTKIERTERALVDLDDSGRPQSIKFENSSAVFSLSTETITDENAYQDAMNQYNYNMQVYEKSIQDINAKTKKIQEQDRTLELRLRQLDTEQEALQTEMEAVKKVIDKNIESTFKTFE